MKLQEDRLENREPLPRERFVLPEVRLPCGVLYKRESYQLARGTLQFHSSSRHAKCKILNF